ncbi:MAG: hypothetical protein JO108_32875 [Acidobacteriaceae bacterium]|nr:hypothetical protein [Acidobacteriaceae bacterium]
MDFKGLEIWFATGSQHLYGREALQKVQEYTEAIVRELALVKQFLVPIIAKPVMTTPDSIRQLCLDANTAGNCRGIIAWMHTFFPAKMWIGGLKNLTKPLLHLHTQFNREIPYATIDMDFMNLNQSSHWRRTEYGESWKLPRAQHRPARSQRRSLHAQ